MPVWSRLDLGVGLIAAGGVDLFWPDIADLVQVVEVEPQTLWDHTDRDGRSIRTDALSWLRSLRRPLLSHGVGFPVGGTTPPEADGVRASARSARELHAVHWSEHLAFNRAGAVAGGQARHAGYLLPPMPTTQTVDAAVAHIAGFQAELDRPFLVETPTSYLRPVPGDLTDGQFVAQVAERADCGILLDLHNIWANQRNGRQPVAEFLAEIPVERVWEVHLAGGFTMDGYYLDAHVGPVPAELLELAEAVVPMLPNVRAVLYEAEPQSIAALGRDGLRAVLEQLHLLAALPCVPVPERRRASTTTTGRDAAARERALLAFTTRADAGDGGDPGTRVLRYLTDHARLSLLVGDCAPELADLLRTYGRERTDELLRDFLARTPASVWPAEQSAAFRDWLGLLSNRFGGGHVGELDEQQPGAPEEADRAQERAAVGKAGR
jgi:uncharacterized protein (UPF0276 family)